MKTFKELVEARESVRAYSAREIEKEKLEYIMECTRWAPSAVNFQPWYFYIVRSEEGQKKLQECYPRDWFNTAPLYILACVDHSRSWKRKTDGKDHADIDIAIGVEHLCLAAAEVGLGTCWVCNFDAARCRLLFGLPDHLEPAVIVPVGYPEREEAKKPRERLGYGEIIEEV